MLPLTYCVTSKSTMCIKTGRSHSMRIPGIGHTLMQNCPEVLSSTQKASVSTGEVRHSAAKLASSYEPATNLALHSQQHERREPSFHPTRPTTCFSQAPSLVLATHAPRMRKLCPATLPRHWRKRLALVVVPWVTPRRESPERPRQKLESGVHGVFRRLFTAKIQ